MSALFGAIFGNPAMFTYLYPSVSSFLGPCYSSKIQKKNRTDRKDLLMWRLMEALKVAVLAISFPLHLSHVGCVCFEFFIILKRIKTYLILE